jgi:steroid 5-alpha reductase family enzyme
MRGLLVALVSATLAVGLYTAAKVPWPVVALCFGLNWLAWIPAAIQKTEHFYDLTGSATYGSAVVLALALASTPAGPGWLVAAMVLTWALRLGSFLFLRVRAAGKDRRFDELKSSPSRFLVAWSLQGLWVALTLLAALVQISKADAAWTFWHALGGAIWALGFGVEILADRQKSSFRASPANAGRFIDTGLWAWSRHPNYAGEIVLWTGVFVMGIGGYTGGGWVAAVSPLFVYALLRFGSGVPLLEAAAEARWGSDPAYRAYAARTPVLFLRG